MELEEGPASVLMRCSVEASGCDGICRRLLTGVLPWGGARGKEHGLGGKQMSASHLSTWASLPGAGEGRGPRGWRGPQLSSQSCLLEPVLSVPAVTGLAVWRGTVQGHFKFSPNWALGNWPGKTSINICLFLLSLTLT